GRDLVDVLAAGAGGADERNLDVVFVDREVAGNPQHGVTGRRIGAQDSGFEFLCCAVSVPSPLAGEGQGGGPSKRCACGTPTPNPSPQGGGERRHLARGRNGEQYANSPLAR